MKRIQLRLRLPKRHGAPGATAPFIELRREKEDDLPGRRFRLRLDGGGDKRVAYLPPGKE